MRSTPPRRDLGCGLRGGDSPPRVGANGEDAEVTPSSPADAGPEALTTRVGAFRVPRLGANEERPFRDRLGAIPGVFAVALDLPAHSLRVAHRLRDCAPILDALVALGLPPHPVGGDRHPAARAGLVAPASEATAPERPFASQLASSTARWGGRLVAGMSRLVALMGRRGR
jgi:hypothetical protein